MPGRGAEGSGPDSPRTVAAPPVYERIVVKVGTNLLTAGGESIDHLALRRVVGQVAALRRGGADVIVVSSGAIAAGRQRLGEHAGRSDVRSRQALAAGKVLRADFVARLAVRLEEDLADLIDIVVRGVADVRPALQP